MGKERGRHSRQGGRGQAGRGPGGFGSRRRQLAAPASWRAPVQCECLGPLAQPRRLPSLCLPAPHQLEPRTVFPTAPPVSRPLETPQSFRC